MENWRKKGDKCNQEFSRTKFNNHHHRKPPIGRNANYIPSWEKRFVSSVGSLSWKKFLEAKKFTYLYDNIIKWDDSAGQEAFQIAKDRFYAQFYGLPCEVDHHNPDLYIDKINWNDEIDQNLIQDLESEPVIPEVNSEHEPVVIFGDVLPDPYKDYSPYGWGDTWGTSNEVKRDENGINWDDYINNGVINWDGYDVGGGNDNGWWDWNENVNKTGDQGWDTNNNNYPCYGNVNNERFHGSNNNQRSRSWRNNGYRKSNGQSYGKQRGGYGSALQAHGTQRIHVQP